MLCSESIDNQLNYSINLGDLQETEAEDIKIS